MRVRVLGEVNAHRYRKMRNSLKGLFNSALNARGETTASERKSSAMYLKKVEGQRAVTLPDGTVLTQADLPPATTRRWVASRKAAVVRGVLYGLISQDGALERYNLSAEEFAEWVRAVSNHGEDALKATALQKYRQL